MSAAEVKCAEDACRLRDRMDRVRSQMDRELDYLKDNSKTFTDWRFYVSGFPLAAVSVAAVTGFLLAPRRRRHPTAQLDDDSIARLVERGGVNIVKSSPKRSLLASAGVFGANLLFRAAIAYVGQQYGKSTGQTAAVQHPSNTSQS